MIPETNRDTPTAPTSDEKWWWRHLYIGKMICTSWWRGVMEIGKTYGFLRFVTCLRVANLPTYFHHKHLRNTSMLFLGQNCQAPESTSNTTKMAIPLYGGGWTTRFAKILWTRPKGESFPQFSDWKVEHVFFGQKTTTTKGTSMVKSCLVSLGCRDSFAFGLNKTSRLMHPKKVDPPETPKNQSNEFMSS